MEFNAIFTCLYLKVKLDIKMCHLANECWPMFDLIIEISDGNAPKTEGRVLQMLHALCEQAVPLTIGSHS